MANKKIWERSGFWITLLIFTYLCWVDIFETGQSKVDLMSKMLDSGNQFISMDSKDTGRLQFYYQAQFAMAPAIVNCELLKDDVSILNISKKDDTTVTTLKVVLK